MTCRGTLGLLFFCAGGALLPLSAQKVVSARAGLLTYLQGTVSIDGEPLVLKTARFPQMKDGETLSTGPGQDRVEVLLAPDIVLRLAENSKVRMDDTDLSDTRVTLQQGEALIEVVQLAEGNRVQLAVGETTTEPTRPGLYRIGISQNATLRVYGGEALVRSGLKTADAKRGMAVNLDADLAVSRFERKPTDSFHDWAAQRSFDLFMSDPEARNKQSHWRTVPGGYIENKNFGVEFPVFLRGGLPRPRVSPIPLAEHP
jgi:ferric-dicitrate binding protein FerR (iron transport regulator)